MTLNLNGTNGAVSFSMTDVVSHTQIDNTAPTPQPPLNKQDISSNYYYMFNYREVIY